jgi:hypothetical protein
LHNFFRSINKHGRHRQFLFLIGQLKKSSLWFIISLGQRCPAVVDILIFSTTKKLCRGPQGMFNLSFLSIDSFKKEEYWKHVPQGCMISCDGGLLWTNWEFYGKFLVCLAKGHVRFCHCFASIICCPSLIFCILIIA